MFMGGLATLQTAAIVGGLPLLVIAVMLMISGVKAATLDLSHQEGYVDPVINIEEFPDVDPWSREGIAMAKFERLKDEAIAAAEEEREKLNAIWVLKKEIRAAALARGESGAELGDAPEEQLVEIQRLTDEAWQPKSISCRHPKVHSRHVLNSTSWYVSVSNLKKKPFWLTRPNH